MNRQTNNPYPIRMNVRLLLLAPALPLLALLLPACGREGGTSPAPAPASHRLQVMTTFYPTTYFAKRIAGPSADIVCPLPKDADAAFWQPSPEILAQYQKADLILVNGANFERWVGTATLPETRVVACADVFKSEWIEIKNALTHSHGPGGMHTHTGINGHTWPDPINAIAEGNAIRDALIARDGAHKADYAANARALENDLLTLDGELKTIAVKGPVFASHPSYNYLARRYGWDLTNFGLEPNEPPTEAQIAEIRKAAADHPGVKLMLWEDAPCPAAQKLMDELGLAVVVFNPGEQSDAKDGDYLALMRANIGRLRAAAK